MTAQTEVVPWRLVRLTVTRIEALGENVRRVTFGGSEVAHLATGGFDQRVKLFFPLPDVGWDSLPDGADWYGEWRALPADRKHPIRTYTIRELRPAAAEVDIDIALHGPVGPASRWALSARPGDELAMLGPNREHGGPYGGVDFLPPGHTGRYLLAGDPTALPAVARILADLPSTARGVAVIEVDHATDAAALGDAPDGVEVRVVVRENAVPGTALIPAVRAAADELLTAPSAAPIDLEDVDVDTGLLWEAPRGENDAPAVDTADVYAWLAGEAAVIKTLRRYLVTERGLDRRAVAFMGYWRLGRAENND